jgi:hypothetical protein
MADLIWLLPWCVAGLPLPSILVKLKLLNKSRGDYAYYVMSRELSVIKAFVVKLSFFLVLGIAFVIQSIPIAGMVPAILALGASTTVLESGLVVGRPYPTPTYRRAKMVCEACRGYEHDDCTNLRMLDGFETNFKSKDGRYRPVCCCGRRISAWREMAV